MPSKRPRNRRNRSLQQKFPFELVVEARKMSKYGWTSSEIAETIETYWGIQVSWRTVYDWITYRYRVIA